MRVSLIVAAGGSGERFRKSGSRHFSSVSSDKLFYPLSGFPVLSYTLEAFRTIPEIREIIISGHPKALGAIGKLVRGARKPVCLVRGGRTRAHSVWNALQKVNRKNNWVMVHDGARPLVRREMISNLLRFARRQKKFGGFILAKKVIPTLKRAGSNFVIEETVDRNLLYEAETPQLIKRQYLWKAYESKGGLRTVPLLKTTDEASLLESLGVPVRVITHKGWNPKITTVEDIKMAEAYLSRNRNRGQDGIRPVPCVKTGFGYDIHRLVRGRKFYLGGLLLPATFGPLGHSDGDVLLHAVVDALLGALGAGDIGDWFSDQNPKFKNAKSIQFLKTVLQKIKKRRLKLIHLDTVIILEKPKLGVYKNKIKIHLARVLGLASSAVSIKAKTHEGVGLEGSGEAVSCYAVVTLGEHL